MTEDEVKKKVREISFNELAKNTSEIRGDTKSHERRRIKEDDPYFNVLDSGRDILVWFRRNKDIKEELLKELDQIYKELEKMLRKVQYDAIDDEFDYNSKSNEYYFDMGQLDCLLEKFSQKLGVFLKNENFLTASGSMTQKDFTKCKTEINKLMGLCDRMEKNVRVFMGELEKEYGFIPTLSKDEALTAKRN